VLRVLLPHAHDGQEVAFGGADRSPKSDELAVAGPEDTCREDAAAEVRPVHNALDDLPKGSSAVSPSLPDLRQNVVQEIRRATRRQYGAEEKIRIVLEGLRGEISVAEFCRREGISPTVWATSWPRRTFPRPTARSSGITGPARSE